MAATLRWIGILLACSLALGLAQAARQGTQAGGALMSSDGDTVDVTDAARSAVLRFDAAVAPADREWIVAALGRARPEAARLIAEVDGLVVVGAYTEGGDTLGVTRGGSGGFTVDLNFARLDDDRAGDRSTVVLHELGHVIDFALVPEETNVALDGQIPRGGPCGLAVDCELLEERFADTFAKWALNGAVSEVGAGYGIPMPASIEDWGAPLARLSYELPAV